jgi:Topoisomerase DNA binding C4 zinc finger
MKLGMRTPSFRKRIAARTSWKRVVRHNMGFKAPRGYGWFTNPRRAAYNRIYNRTTFKADPFIGLGASLIAMLIVGIFSGITSLFSGSSLKNAINADNSVTCPRCLSPMVLRKGSRGRFFGCSRFPRCRGTRNFIETTPTEVLPTPLTQVSDIGIPTPNQ